MRKMIVIAAVLAVAGCSKKKSEDKAATSGSAAPGSAASNPGAGEAKPVEAKPDEAKPDEATPPESTDSPSMFVPLTCDQILPKALRDKYYAGLAIKDGGNQGGSWSGTCAITRKEGGSDQYVSVGCFKPDMQAEFDSHVASLKEKKYAEGMAKALDGIGKGAFIEQDALDDKKEGWITAYDDNSTCMVKAWAPAGVDRKTLITDVLAVHPLK